MRSAEEHERDRRTRAELISAAREAGVHPQFLVRQLKNLFDLVANDGPELRRAIETTAKLIGAAPTAARTEVSVLSDQRVQSLTFGDGVVREIAPEELARLSPEERRAYFALQRKLGRPEDLDAEVIDAPGD